MIALLHADGTFPNLALMRLGTYFRRRGEPVRLVRAGQRPVFTRPRESYGSSIFEFSAKTREAMERDWGPVRWGGTGVRVESDLREVAIEEWEDVPPDYSLYPDFEPSIGFTQRGCRLSCKFCVVPRKEGKPKSVHSIWDIWRGEGHPKKIVLLDNDFFGQSRETWKTRIDEVRTGGFKVCFSQGINIRMVDEESARALASIEYRDNAFSSRVLYTAWDNLGDEEIFKKGVATLAAAGVPPKHLRVYMLVGFAKGETMDQIMYRFKELVALGCEPYPMPFDQTRKDLKRLQRWAVTGLYRAGLDFSDYDPHYDCRNTKEASARATAKRLAGERFP